MKELMYDVVYNGATKMWQPNNVTLMAKTGTAQIASPKGGYLTGEFDSITSLAGIFPKENPQYIIYIANKRMQGARSYQAQAITKAIDEIASYAKLTSKVNNDKQLIEQVVIDNYISDDISETEKKLKDQGLNAIVIGQGKFITNQYPLKSSKVFIGSKVFLKTNSDEIIIPDFKGFSMNEIKTYALLANRDIKINGYGYVISQNIEQGTLFTNDLNLEVELQ